MLPSRTAAIVLGLMVCTFMAPGAGAARQPTELGSTAGPAADVARNALRAHLPSLGDIGEVVGLLRQYEPADYAAFEDKFVRAAMLRGVDTELSTLAKDIEVGIRFKREIGLYYVPGHDLGDRLALQAMRAPPAELLAFVKARQAVTPIITRSKPRTCQVFMLTYGAVFGAMPLPQDRSGAVVRYREARRALFEAAAAHPQDRPRGDRAYTDARMAALESRGMTREMLREIFSSDLPAAGCDIAADWLAAHDGMGPEEGVRSVRKY